MDDHHDFILHEDVWPQHERALWHLIEEIYDHGGEVDNLTGRYVRAIYTVPTRWVERRSDEISGRLKSNPASRMPSRAGAFQAFVENIVGWEPHMCTANLFRNGDDWMAQHQDGPSLFEPTFAVLSFGCSRIVQLSSIGLGEPEEINHVVPGGSLYTFGRGVQTHFTHGVPRESDRPVPRVSLTFTRLTRMPSLDSYGVLVLDEEEYVVKPIEWTAREDAHERAESLARKGYLAFVVDPFTQEPWIPEAGEAYKQRIDVAMKLILKGY